jgi:hypothetical protein
MLFARLSKGRGRWKTSRAHQKSNGCALRETLREQQSCAETRTGEATYARGRKCENALELQGGRTPAESPDQAIARESTLDKRRRRYGGAGVHTENAWKQTRRQLFGVAGRKTSERARSIGT